MSGVICVLQAAGACRVLSRASTSSTSPPTVRIRSATTAKAVVVAPKKTADMPLVIARGGRGFSEERQMTIARFFYERRRTMGVADMAKALKVSKDTMRKYARKHRARFDASHQKAIVRCGRYLSVRLFFKVLRTKEILALPLSTPIHQDFSCQSLDRPPARHDQRVLLVEIEYNMNVLCLDPAQVASRKNCVGRSTTAHEMFLVVNNA